MFKRASPQMHQTNAPNKQQGAQWEPTAQYASSLSLATPHFPPSPPPQPLHIHVCVDIHVGRALIQDQNLWGSQQRTGEAQKLPLTDAEILTVLSDLGSDVSKSRAA
jgi:hypothetical protein